jgi:hypothetical protein
VSDGKGPEGRYIEGIYTSKWERCPPGPFLICHYVRYDQLETKYRLTVFELKRPLNYHIRAL